MGKPYSWQRQHDGMHLRIDTDAKVLDRVATQYQKDFDDVMKEVFRRWGGSGKINKDDMVKTLSIKQRDDVRKIARRWIDSGKYDQDKIFIARLHRLIDKPTLRRQHFVEINLRRVASKIKIEQKGVILKSLYQTWLDSERTVARITNAGFTMAGDDFIFKRIGSKFMGSTLYTRLFKSGDDLYRRVKEGIRLAGSNGASLKSLKLIGQYALSNGDYKAKRILVTESTRINSEAKLLGYKKANVKWYQYISVMDDRTTDKCVHLDLKVYRVSKMKIGVNAPPTHINCRSSTKAYFIDDRSKGSGVKPPPNLPPYTPPRPVKDMSIDELKQEQLAIRKEIDDNRSKYSANIDELEEKNLELRRKWKEDRYKIRDLPDDEYEKARLEYLAERKKIQEMIEEAERKYSLTSDALRERAMEVSSEVYKKESLLRRAAEEKLRKEAEKERLKRINDGKRRTDTPKEAFTSAGGRHFNEVFKHISDDAKMVLAQLDEPRLWNKARKGAGGGYASGVKRISAYPKDYNMIMHEYGHFIDNILDNSGMNNYYSRERLEKFAEMDWKKFTANGKISAESLAKTWKKLNFDSKKIYFKSGRRKGMLKGIQQVPKDGRVDLWGVWSDIYDSMSKGKFFDEFLPGHGSKYYLDDVYNQQTENFANLFSIWSTDAQGWKETKALFPNLAGEFEKVMEDILNGVIRQKG